MTERDKGVVLAARIVRFIEAKRDLMTRAERFLLALGARKLLMHYGEIRTRKEISLDAGVSPQAIEQIELRALRKCRRTALRIMAAEHMTLR